MTSTGLFAFFSKQRVTENNIQICLCTLIENINKPLKIFFFLPHFSFSNMKADGAAQNQHLILKYT